jgi:hypothetical protein
MSSLLTPLCADSESLENARISTCAGYLFLQLQESASDPITMTYGPPLIIVNYPDDLIGKKISFNHLLLD